MNKKILITGSEGFIGSHLVEMLIKKDYLIKCLVQYNSFNHQGWLDKLSAANKNKIEIILGDVRDSEQMMNIVKDVHTVINLAALIGIPYSYSAPRSYFETNLFGLMNLLEASKKNNIKKFIHTSTSEVYGKPIYFPIDENHRLLAQSPYAASKISADQLAISYMNSFNMPISIIRPFNTFGPRQSQRAIIPTIIQQYLSKNQTVKLGSLFPVRDLTYVDDTVYGFIKAIENKKCIGEIINLGTGYGVSIRELTEIISKILGIKKKIIKENRRTRPKKSELVKLISSNNKAKKILNWKPKYYRKSGLEKAIKKTIEWYKLEKNLKYFKSNNFVV